MHEAIIEKNSWSGWVGSNIRQTWETVKSAWNNFNALGVYNEQTYSILPYLPQNVLSSQENSLRRDIYSGLLRLSENDENLDRKLFISQLKTAYHKIDELEIIHKVEQFVDQYFPGDDEDLISRVVSAKAYKKLINQLENYFDSEKSFVSYTQSFEIITDSAHYIFNYPLELITHGLLLVGVLQAYKKSPIPAIGLSAVSTSFFPLVSAQMVMANQFLNNFNGNYTDSAYAAFGKNDGSTIIAGVTGMYGPLNTADAFVAKLFNNGTVAWTSRISVDNYDVANTAYETVDDGIIIAGNTQGSDGQTQDIFVAKTSVEGNLQWVTRFGGSASDDARAVCSTFDGHSIIAGYTRSFGFNDNAILVAKILNNGSLTWAASINSVGYDVVFGAQPIPSGGTILTGYTGSGSIILKLMADGSLAWIKQVVWDGVQNYALDATITLDDASIITGYTQDSDSFIAKIWNNGTFAWAIRGAQGCSAKAVSLTKTGDILVALELADLLAIKILNNGSLAWATRINLNGHENAYDIFEASDNGIVIAGYTNSFNGIFGDVLVVKLDQNGKMVNCSNAIDVTNDVSFSFVNFNLLDITSQVNYKLVTPNVSNIVMNTDFAKLSMNSTCFSQSLGSNVVSTSNLFTGTTGSISSSSSTTHGAGTTTQNSGSTSSNNFQATTTSTTRSRPHEITDDSNGSNANAIAGGVIGGLACAGVLLCTGFFAAKKRRQIAACVHKRSENKNNPKEFKMDEASKYHYQKPDSVQGNNEENPYSNVRDVRNMENTKVHDMYMPALQIQENISQPNKRYSHYSNVPTNYDPDENKSYVLASSLGISMFEERNAPNMEVGREERVSEYVNLP